MTRDLSRLLRPKSIAVVGGGVWCASVIEQAEKLGFDGAIWPVHPTRPDVAGHGTFPDVHDLPAAPDAAFVGVNRTATVDVVRTLSAMGAGGAVCFASGFSEAAAEDAGAGDLQAALVDAAGAMPVLGPNCYGYVNALDHAALWPDQHGCTPVQRGVAILTQSSNIAINLTMQQRALPIAYVITCGNMAQTSQAEIAVALLDDPRVTAIGLHVEGFGDVTAWQALAAAAHARSVPLVALKVGASDQAQAATLSHTASLAGSAAGAKALLQRLGVAQVHDVPTLVEALKLLHCTGPLADARLASISCSGGEASLMADMGASRGIVFPPLAAPKKTTLRAALGDRVALNNPLDYHTYIWGDVPRMTAAWAAMTGPEIDLTVAVVDYPTTDPAAWICTVDAALAVRAQTGRPFGVVASLPELMPGDIAARLMAGGVVPLNGIAEALAAVRAAADIGPPHALPLWPTGALEQDARLVSEAHAKAALAAHGLEVPRLITCTADEASAAAAAFTGPVAVKAVGLAHKSETGAVRLNVDPEDVAAVAAEIGADAVLIEEMIGGAVAELILGVVRDPAHGFVLTIGAGGLLTEVMRDTASLLLPATDDDIRRALDSLKVAPLLTGYRGAPPAAVDRIIAAAQALQTYVFVTKSTLAEVEINPLICTPEKAVAVDALIRKV
ncbi:MAG: acetate--CoA ligase family protein [Pseudomonadota bacterium]